MKSLNWNFCPLTQSESENCSVVSNSLGPHGLYSPGNSPGQNTGVGSLSFLYGIVPTQRLNPGLPYCMWTLCWLSHKGSPWVLEWVAYPFSSRSSQPRNGIGVSWIAGGFFTNWAFREALISGRPLNQWAYQMPPPESINLPKGKAAQMLDSFLDFHLLWDYSPSLVSILIHVLYFSSISSFYLGVSGKWI